MSFFNRKKSGHYNILTEKYVPASLPTEGLGLETFVTGDYPMNKHKVIETAYRDLENHLEDVISTCDHHSAGNECDHYIDAEIEHAYAVHESAIANNENQIARIRSARKMRKAALERQIIQLEENITKLKAEIAPLESLRSQFQIHVGCFDISVGLPITIVSMIVDGLVNYSFLQDVLLSNAILLLITVICLSVMSDGCMWALGTFLSRKGEHFVSKPLFWITCVSLLSMFIISVLGSIMIRWGSMPSTYGTINAAGEFIGKKSYSLAEYGTTLVTSLVTTATGLLSFCFSLDENAFPVSIRERKKKELAKCLAELDPLLNERVLLESAPDPREWDERKRAAAEHQLEATRVGLKLHVDKKMAVHINEPDFTERMAKSREALLKDASLADISRMPTTITLNKVS